MSRQLFDDEQNEEDFSFQESEYSKKYERVRRKEELLKLKNKYGDAAKNSDSSSSDNEDEDVVFTERFQKDFFKTLSCLKKKDPRIYNKDVRFFSEDKNASGDKKSDKKKEKAITIRDYNREIVLKKQREADSGEDDDEKAEDIEDPSMSPSYVQEQNDLKKIFSSAVDDAEDHDEIGGLFSRKKKTTEEANEDEESYREWLAGQSKHLRNQNDESDLKPLKEYWTNPDLDENEAFLRDYVLNERFREPSDKKKIPSYDEIINDMEAVSEDEKLVGRQVEFEHKFNFRFEEPDQDFIKQYPRTLEHTIRLKDNKRSKKRAEVKQRKTEEKLQKKQEISQLKALKLKEIEEKISKLKEITGNDQLGFSLEDIEGDFDPEAHDKRMQELFNEGYYDDGTDKKKPEFPDIDEELEIENWDNWEEKQNETEPHCEDEDFNMDCDYRPEVNGKKSAVENITDSIEPKKRRRKKKGKLAELLLNEKPVFDPTNSDKKLSEYIDEYYKLDCEDVIGDIPCRFQYREVPACNYGLTLEEILLADDAELNKWYPLKKTLQHRPEHLQKSDQKIYEKKAFDVNLKRKILPSLYKQDEELEKNPENTQDETISKKKKKKSKKKRKNRETDSMENNSLPENNIRKEKGKPDTSVEECQINGDVENASTKKLKKEKRKHILLNNDNNSSAEMVAVSTDKKSSKKQPKNHSPTNKSAKNKNWKVETNEPNNDDQKADHQNIKTNNKQKNINKHKKKNIGKLKNKNKHHNGDKLGENISDERLKAYGLNPKKYRSFMKFKKF